MDGEELLDPNVQNLLDQEDLKWIFVGGKGGVGKTTTSCSLGVLLSTVRDSVLIVSTDPAHNLSDAFCQKFSHEPMLVKGFSNLYCMEVESEKLAMDMTSGEEFNTGTDGFDLQKMMKDVGGALPGIDETMSFLQIMKSVKQMEYSVIVFDTAPTGHTLRLLRFPTTLQSTFEKMMSLKNRFQGLFGTITSMMGGGSNVQETMLAKFEEMKSTVEEVNVLFRDPNITTFVCVCIPEFLSVYETERLIQELTKYEIDSHNLIVNQVLFAEKDSCRKLLARKKMQDKYLNNIYSLYGEDFNITVLPITDEEVRGVEKLKSFSKNYLVPFTVPADSESDKEKIVKIICESNGLDVNAVTNELKQHNLM